jgi:hypothetical protein
MKTFEHNVQTDEIIERDLTAAEIKQIEIDSKTDLEFRKNIEEKEIKKSALLNRLGLTPEEALILLS